jgi:gustatory receptor
MARTSGLFLFASRIYESSRKPLQITRTIPNEGWSQEIERFDDQIHSEMNALSGMNFFYLTRSVLFGLAGTILTYELVLLQYNTAEEELDAWVNCRN